MPAKRKPLPCRCDLCLGRLPRPSSYGFDELLLMLNDREPDFPSRGSPARPDDGDEGKRPF